MLEDFRANVLNAMLQMNLIQCTKKMCSHTE